MAEIAIIGGQAIPADPAIEAPERYLVCDQCRGLIGGEAVRMELPKRIWIQQRTFHFHPRCYVRFLDTTRRAPADELLQEVTQ